MSFTVLLALLAGVERPSLVALYRQARRYDQANFRFTPPSEEQRRTVEALAAALSAHDGSSATRRQASEAGLALTRAEDSAGPVWVLHEPEGHRAGSGLYAFRPGGAAVCVQAPHTFFDSGTGEIALEIFARLRAGCLAVNTVHRYTAAADGAGHPADMAHAAETLFQAVSRAVIARAHWPIVQIHGFGPREDVPAAAAAVVSDGTRRFNNQGPAARLRATLAHHLGERVLLYPGDVQVLGATGNVQGREARRAAVPFLHVELAAGIRQRLTESGATPLAEALREALSLH
jgi:hypothetical protein